MKAEQHLPQHDRAETATDHYLITLQGRSQEHDAFMSRAKSGTTTGLLP